MSQLFPNGILFEANDGQAAVDEFRKEKPNIILMVVQMPIMSGCEATIEIRKMESGKKVPIIAVSAGTVKEDLEKCFQVGMHDYTSKPIVKNTLTKILLAWLS